MTPNRRHADFEIRYIWEALTLAICAGFAIGAHLAFVIGYDLSLGRGFVPFIQAHGHVQLVGWAGLFIVGISLHMIPRLASVPLSHPGWIPLILWLMTAGLAVRTVAQTTLPYVTGTALFVPANWAVAVSGALEWAGIVLYGLLLFRTVGGIGHLDTQPALRSVRPYFSMVLAGWLIYTSLNLVLLMEMAWRGNTVVHPGWNELAVQVFTGMTLLPAAFAFSVRMLPLYLTLRAPDWPVRGASYAYLGCVALQLVPTVPPLSEMASGAASSLSSLGMLLKGGAVLWFVWQLGILTRRWEPWTAKRRLPPGPGRRPTRPGLPDYGEFGRFELLVYAAYMWLVLAACFEILDGGAVLLGAQAPVGTDAIRHMVVLGFVTHLILGVSVRLLPGLLQKKRIAGAGLVKATLWLDGTGRGV